MQSLSVIQNPAPQSPLFAQGPAPVEPAWSRPMRVPCGHRVAATQDVVVVDGLDGKVSGLRAASGEPSWSHDVGHMAGSLALSPDGATVFGVTLKGDLVALDARTGDERWRNSLGEDFSQGVAVGEDGFLALRSNTNAVYGVEPTTGKVLWKQPMKELARNLVVAPDRTVLVTDYSLKVHALRGDDGTPRWVYPSRTMVSSLETDRETVYMGHDFGQVTALDVATGQPHWSVYPKLPDQGRLNSPNLLLQEEDRRLLVSDDGGHLFALSAQDGHLEWSTRATSWRRTPPVATGDEICAGTQDRTIHAVDDETGAPTWSWKLAGETLAFPSVSPDGTVYCTDDAGNVHAARPEERFRAAAERAVASPGELADCRVEVAEDWVQIGDVRMPRQAAHRLELVLAVHGRPVR